MERCGASHSLAPSPPFWEIHPDLLEALSGRRVIVYNASYDRRPGSRGWRLQRKPELVPVADNLAALAGQSFADAEEIESATRVATKQLNGRAKP